MDESLSHGSATDVKTFFLGLHPILEHDGREDLFFGVGIQ